MTELFTSRDFDALEESLVTGIQNYMEKNGFRRLHLGLSGGIDSALTAYLAVKAAGGENVTCFGLPSQFSSRESVDDSRELAESLGCRFEVLSIEPLFEKFLSVLEGVFEGRPFDTAEENLQSRIRGVLLMAFSNKFNSMLLATGNKSELATGYCTLYGDMIGALAPIGDLFKTEVYAFCRRINEREGGASKKPPISQAIIDKPPSAELRPGQKDQDTLPPYDLLDEILFLHLHKNLSADEIISQYGTYGNTLCVDKNIVENIIAAVERAQFKRRQAPPAIPASQRAFDASRKSVAGEVYEI